MTAACVLQVQYQRTNTMCEKSKEAWYYFLQLLNYFLCASLLASKIFTVGNMLQLSADQHAKWLLCKLWEHHFSVPYLVSPFPMFLPFYIIQLVKSLPFNRPYKREAWRYPFQAEPLRIRLYREYTLGSWLILFPHSEPIWLHDRRSNNIHSINTYFASSVNAIRPEAIAVAADVASKISIHPDFWSAVICGIGQISRLLPE